jgi:hypothetical protein
VPLGHRIPLLTPRPRHFEYGRGDSVSPLASRPSSLAPNQSAPARIRTRNAAFEARSDSVSPPGHSPLLVTSPSPLFSDPGGSRTHKTPALNRSCLPVPARSHPKLQTWELNPASRLMRPGRAPARLHQGASGDGGIRTHTVHVLSVATPAVGLHHLANLGCGIGMRIWIRFPNFTLLPRRPWRDLNPRPPP